MAVLCFFFRAQLREGLLNLRKIKQWVIAESTCPSRSVKNHAFGCALKNRQGPAIARRCYPTHKSATALLLLDSLDLANQLSVISFIMRIRLRPLWIIRRIARGMNAGSVAQCVHFEPR